MKNAVAVGGSEGATVEVEFVFGDFTDIKDRSMVASPLLALLVWWIALLFEWVERVVG